MMRYLAIPFLFFGSISHATDYYVYPGAGDDRNSGTEKSAPWKSLDKVNATRLQAGDSVWLAAGSTFYGYLELKNVKGAPEQPISISSYAADADADASRALIDASGFLAGVHVINGSHIEISNLAVTANGEGPANSERTKRDLRCGALVETTRRGNYGDIHLDNLHIRDVFFEAPGFTRGDQEVKTANGTQSYGWGIRVINRNKKAVVSNVSITNSQVSNVSHTGIKFSGRNHNIRNVRVDSNRVVETGGPGIQMSGVTQAIVSNNVVDGSGSVDDSRKWGRGSGLWTWGSSDVLIEKNAFLNANGPGDSAGVHIDFNCRNVVVQYNLSANNAGGFCEILGNNFNNAYRYNVSINDGYRVKGSQGAFQEGKTFWLSGYRGHEMKRQGPFNSYFYNNTIFTNKDIVAKFAIDWAARGILIVNNIFYVEGESRAVLGDQYNPQKARGSRVQNVVFENNLFLRPDNWPENVLIQPDTSIFGDPGFAFGDDVKISDFAPQNVSLVKDAGIPIQKIPGDDIGLTIGLSVSHDILGNPITGKPDIGAIELE